MADIDDIRRQNIIALELEMGGAPAFAEAIGMTETQYLNLRNGAKDSKTGKQRGMHKSTATRIESAAGKPPGWLSVPHPTGAAAQLEEELLIYFRGIDDAERLFIVQRAKALYSASHMQPPPAPKTEKMRSNGKVNPKVAAVINKVKAKDKDGETQ